MNHTSLLTTTPPLLLPQTSRTIVIGVGDFGLRVISLLLPRLEVYYQFVSADQSRLITRCGVVQAGTPGYQALTIERAPMVLGLVREIQRLILTDDPGTSTRLSQILELDSQWQNSSDLLSWLDGLVRPVQSDNWSHTSFLANLHIYLVCDDSGDIDTALAVAQAIRQLPGTLFTNLLLHVGSLPAPTNPPVTDRLDQAISAGVLHHIFLSHTTTAHHTRHDPPGEPAIVMCNFVETMVLSTLADTHSEQILPDTERLTNNAPYSVLGASKLYVPVAEMTSIVLESFITGWLRTLMQNKPPEFRDTPPHHDHPQLESICRQALRGTDIWLRRHSVPLGLHARAVWLRFWRSPEADELVAQRQAMGRLPHLKVSRRYWREFRAAFGRHLSEAAWWNALTLFERRVLYTDLPHWIAEGGKRLGVSPQDESAIRAFAQLPQTNDPLVPLLAQATPEQRADLLTQWFNTRLSQHPPGTALREAVLADIFSRQQTGSALPHDQLADVVARLLWRSRAVPPGLLHAIDSDLRRKAASLIAESPQGLLEIADILQRMRQRASAAEQDLASWHTFSHRHAPQLAQHLSHARLETAKQRLVQCMNKRPYPASLIGRLIIVWLLPLLLGTLADPRVDLPLPFGLNLLNALVWWTSMMIAAYVLIIGAAELDIWLARRRIEQIVLARLDRAIEQAFYANDPYLTPGLLITYLDTLRRQVIGATSGADWIPAPLLGAVEDTIAAFRQEEQLLPLPVPVCTAYRSVGDDLIRDLIEVYLRSKLELQQSSWLAQPQQIQVALLSGQALRDHIRTTLQVQAIQQHSQLLRTLPLLHLANLLQMPENTRYGPMTYLDDLLQRARPMVDLSKAYQHKYPYEKISYVSVDKNSALLLQRSIGRSGREYQNISYDPFGISYIIIIHGLARESLPFR